MTEAVGFVEGATWLRPAEVLTGAEHLAGVDPGDKGAIALLSRLGTGKLAGTLLMPRDEMDLSRGLKDLGRLANLRGVAVEELHAMPTSYVAMFRLGMSFGVIKGTLYATDEPFALVPARDWRKLLRLQEVKEYKQRKRDNAVRVGALWPGIVPERAADACGLALYLAVRRGWVTV
jgi:hypothetical protein